MTFFKEHHHTLLVTLFLIGALLVAGSFEARLPDSAIAATTPGSQSVQKNAVWRFDSQGQLNDAAMTQVNYTGEVRDKNTGALITSDTKLKPGDQVTLDIFANSSYFTTGLWLDSPPAPWVGDDFLSKLLPSSWTYRGVFSERYAYEYKNFPYSDNVLGVAPAGYCSSQHTVLGFDPISPVCLQTSVKKPTVNLNTNGLNCGVLAESDTSEGVRKYSTTCTITTSGPQAHLTSNISATTFYYPAAAAELSPSVENTPLHS